MKTVIVGCGRVGAAVAEALDRAGHQVILIDRTTSAFDKLEDSFKGAAIRGDGTDEDVLRRAGAEGAELFLALTEGDNRNVMAAQLATEAFGVNQVVAKVNDPVRAEAYAALGLATICRTDLLLDALMNFIGMGTGPIRGVQEATGTHPGGDHPDGAVLGAATAAPRGDATTPSAPVSGTGTPVTPQAGPTTPSDGPITPSGGPTTPAGSPIITREA
jgi:trk system potassium uptake protein TrkA